MKLAIIHTQFIGSTQQQFNGLERNVSIKSKIIILKTVITDLMSLIENFRLIENEMDIQENDDL